jgi:hypothetical protein
VKLHQKDVADNKSHLKGVNAELIKKTTALKEKIEKLSV